MARNIYLAPHPRYAIAGGIAQGLQSGLTAYNNAQAAQMKAAMMREQIGAMAAYRQAQAEAMRQKYAPVDVNLGNLYAAGQAAQGGPGVDYNPYAGRSVRMSPAEIGLAKGSFAPNASVTGAQIRSGTELEKKRMEGQNHLAAIDKQYGMLLEIAKQNNASKQIVENIKGQWGSTRQKIAGDYGLKATQIRADATTDAAETRADATLGAAKIRAKAQTQKPGASLSDKAALQQLKDYNREILGVQNSINNPTKGIEGVILTEEQKAQRLQHLQNQHQILQQQRDQLYNSYPALKGGTPAPQPAGPAAPPSGPAKAPSLSGAQPSAGMGPARIYELNEAAKAPAGAMIRVNGNIHRVTTPSPDGVALPKVDSSPVQMGMPSQPDAQPQVPVSTGALPPMPANLMGQ